MMPHARAYFKKFNIPITLLSVEVERSFSPVVVNYPDGPPRRVHNLRNCNLPEKMDPGNRFVGDRHSAHFGNSSLSWPEKSWDGSEEPEKANTSCVCVVKNFKVKVVAVCTDEESLKSPIAEKSCGNLYEEDAWKVCETTCKMMETLCRFPPWEKGKLSHPYAPLEAWPSLGKGGED